MIRANVNNYFCLEDFYDNSLYLVEINNNEVIEVKKTKNGKSIGYIAIEQCGLWHKKTKTFGVFCIEDIPYVIIDNKVLNAKKQNISIKLNLFWPLIQSFEFGSDNDFVKCVRWSKDIDEFAMDDFFYFLKYSYNNTFKNICNLKDIKNQGLR